MNDFLILIIKRGREDGDLRGSVVNLCGLQCKNLCLHLMCAVGFSPL
jgi:hypothetical protein